MSDTEGFNKKFMELYSKATFFQGVEEETKDMTDKELKAKIKRLVRKIGLEDKKWS